MGEVRCLTALHPPHHTAQIEAGAGTVRGLLRDLPPTLDLATHPTHPGSATSRSCPTCGKVLVDQPNFCSACGGDLRGFDGNSDTHSGHQAGRLIDDRYRLLEKLGEGGMGSVFKVEHVRMGKIAALKIMRSDLAINSELKKRFLQEARTVAKLSHANTVQVFDAGKLDDGSLFMAMEYVPGKDMAWHLKANGPMLEANVVSLAVQLLSSLQEAHEHGIVHRDLKPANVMLVKHRRGEDQVKLLDFGIAKLLEKEASPQDFIGTPAYMSPEQIRGHRIDARSDLYSLGAMLFELVTGQPPFDGASPIQIINLHLTAAVPVVAEKAPAVVVSPAFEAVLRRALAKEPADRFRDAEDMRKALEGVRRDLGVTTGEFTPIPLPLSSKMLSREDFDKFERSLRRQRNAAPLVAALGLLAFGLAGWRYATNRPADVPLVHEVEPNDQLTQATLVGLDSDVKGSIGSALLGQNDRDLYKLEAARGNYRVTLSAIADLNLTLEVLQVADTVDGRRLQRVVFLDDVGDGLEERLDSLVLAEGTAYVRVEEKPFCTQPNRPSREKSLVPYTLRVERMAGEGLEYEPNDTPGTAQLVTTSHFVAAFAGVKADDPERMASLRADAPFTAFDWFRIEASEADQVAVLIVPPERGTLLVTDGAALEGWRLRKSLSTPNHPAPLPPAPVAVRASAKLLELKALEGQTARRVRITPGDEAVAGSPYLLAAASSAAGGLDAVLELAARLGAANRPETQRTVLEWGLKVFERSSSDAHLLKEALNQLP